MFLQFAAQKKRAIKVKLCTSLRYLKEGEKLIMMMTVEFVDGNIIQPLKHELRHEEFSVEMGRKGFSVSSFQSRLLFNRKKIPRALNLFLDFWFFVEEEKEIQNFLLR